MTQSITQFDLQMLPWSTLVEVFWIDNTPIVTNGVSDNTINYQNLAPVDASRSVLSCGEAPNHATHVNKAGFYRSIVLIELFGGIAPTALAAEYLGVSGHSSKHYYSETATYATRVVKKHFPNVVELGDVSNISDAIIDSIANDSPEDALLLLCAGPPCVDVSQLNASRTGAWGVASALREHVGRIYRGLQRSSSGRCLGVMECTVMSASDRVAYDKIFGGVPIQICSRHWFPVTRPRWWWISASVVWPVSASFRGTRHGIQELLPSVPSRILHSELLLPGWSSTVDPIGHEFFCLTRRVRRNKPLFQPRGLETATRQEKQRWKDDFFSQDPYEAVCFWRDALLSLRPVLGCAGL